MQGQPGVGDLPPYIKDVYSVNSMANFFFKGYMDVRKASSVFPEDDPPDIWQLFCLGLGWCGRVFLNLLLTQNSKRRVL